jgi:hypothetical protein
MGGECNTQMNIEKHIISVGNLGWKKSVGILRRVWSLAYKVVDLMVP